MSVILVTHDFGIVAGMCKSIKVMYEGKIVEEGTADEIFYSPEHPYTKELLKAIPTGEKGERLYSLGTYETNESRNNNQQMVYLTETHRVLKGEGKYA